jgi:HK97 gp10 family phage protein
MPAQVEWTNRSEWERAILRVFRQWEGQFPHNAADLAALAEREAKSRAPVRTGRLRNGINGRVETTDDSTAAILENQVPYAGFVEFGTRHNRAQPHMRPGFAAAEAAYAKTMVKGCE